MLPLHLPPAPLDGQVLRALAQPDRLGERVGPQQELLLGHRHREPLAALRPPALEHGATGPRRHAGPEPVAPLPATDVGLEGSLHRRLAREAVQLAGAQYRGAFRAGAEHGFSPRGIHSREAASGAGSTRLSTAVDEAVDRGNSLQNSLFSPVEDDWKGH